MRFAVFTRPDDQSVWINPSAVAMVTSHLDSEEMTKINFAGSFQIVKGRPEAVIKTLEEFSGSHRGS